MEAAAASEPERSLLRSYLGKAYYDSAGWWAQDGRLKTNAVTQLELAEALDPNDPTPRLYSALLDQQQNRINEAITNLEQSAILNANRQVYRSQLLLDQDRAVRGANLAAIYRDAGMDEVSVREAARAVNSDYANYSAHLFLANSYDALRDPTLITLRYDRVWYNELLVANLLAPVGAGSLSQYTSQQEYSRLFDRDALRLSSSTTYTSRGDWQQTASQFGTSGNTSYSLDVAYQSQNGWRPNEHLEQREAHAKIKQQVSPEDTLFFQYSGYHYTAGDVLQYYDQTKYSPDRRVDAPLDPILLAGYHREWGPGSHTLFIAGAALEGQTLSETNQPVTYIWRRTNPFNQIATLVQGPVDSVYQDEFQLYLGELQQVWQLPPFSSIVGMACQAGSFHTVNVMRGLTNSNPAFPADSRTDDLRTHFQRFGLYGYESWQATDALLFTGGLSYDRQHYPVDFLFPVISAKEEDQAQWSPKVGGMWTPAQGTTLRACYTRSLGGITDDQRFRLEPTQVAGFNQAFRDLIPENVAAPVMGARFETWGVAMEHEFHTRTYVGADFQQLGARARQAAEGFDYYFQQQPAPIIPTTSIFHNDLQFRERDVVLTLNQLLGEVWALSAVYRVGEARLKSFVAEFPASNYRETATLQQLNLSLLFNHPNGFFARGTGAWYGQSNGGYDPDLPGDRFWQLDLAAGFRFPNRKAEVQLVLFNVTDQDYKLNPLNLYAELPRRRMLAVSFKFDL